MNEIYQKKLKFVAHIAHSKRSVLVLIRRTQIRSLIIKMGDFCDHRIFLGDPNPCEQTI